MQTLDPPNSARCPRCGSPLRRPGVACERHSCRPAALRVIRLCPIDKDTDPTSPVVGSMGAVLPPGIATPILEQQEHK